MSGWGEILKAQRSLQFLSRREPLWRRTPAGGCNWVVLGGGALVCHVLPLATPTSPPPFSETSTAKRPTQGRGAGPPSRGRPWWPSPARPPSGRGFQLPSAGKGRAYRPSREFLLLFWVPAPPPPRSSRAPGIRGRGRIWEGLSASSPYLDGSRQHRVLFLDSTSRPGAESARLLPRQGCAGWGSGQRCVLLPAPARPPSLPPSLPGSACCPAADQPALHVPRGA